MSLLRNDKMNKIKALRWKRLSYREGLRLITGQKTKGEGKLFGRKILNMPSSTPNELILPLVPGTSTFSTASFNSQWAEGRITQQELHQVLGELSAALKFSFEEVRESGARLFVNKYKLIGAYKDALDGYLRQLDSRFASRGLQFRAGQLGVYISLKKTGPPPRGFWQNQYPAQYQHAKLFAKFGEDHYFGQQQSQALGSTTQDFEGAHPF